MMVGVLFHCIQTNQNQTKQTKGPNINKGKRWRYLGGILDVLWFLSSLLINMPISSGTLNYDDVGKSGCIQQGRGVGETENHSTGWQRLW